MLMHIQGWDELWIGGWLLVHPCNSSIGYAVSGGSIGGSGGSLEPPPTPQVFKYPMKIIFMGYLRKMR